MYDDEGPMYEPDYYEEQRQEEMAMRDADTQATKRQKAYLLVNLDRASEDILNLVIRRYIERYLTKEEASKIIGKVVDEKRREATEKRKISDETGQWEND